MALPVRRGQTLRLHGLGVVDIAGHVHGVSEVLHEIQL